MVPRRRWGGGVARVEAEHDRSPGALSCGFPVRALYWDADPHGLGRNPVLRRALHQQCGEHRRDERARAVDQPGARLVAEAGEGEQRARRPRRRGVDVFFLRGGAAGVLRDLVEHQPRSALSRTFLQPDRPTSVDAELMIRMLIVGYCRGIRSERVATRTSPRWPGVTSMAMGRTRASAMGAWIFVVRPPRERPIACASAPLFRPPPNGAPWLSCCRWLDHRRVRRAPVLQAVAAIGRASSGGERRL